MHCCCGYRTCPTCRGAGVVPDYYWPWYRRPWIVPYRPVPVVPWPVRSAPVPWLTPSRGAARDRALAAG